MPLIPGMMPDGYSFPSGAPRACPSCHERVWPTERASHLASHVDLMQDEVYKPGQTSSSDGYS